MSRRLSRASVGLVENNIEDAVRESVTASQRMDAFQVQQEAYRIEENPEEVQAAVMAGDIDQSEAAKLNARQRMHGRRESVDSVMEANMAAADFMTTEQMLEQTLVVESKFGLVRKFKNATGIRALELTVAAERARRKSAQFRHPLPFVMRCVQSGLFEIVVGGLMIINGLLIGVQTSLARTDEAAEDLLESFEHFFTAVFVLEVCVRLLAFGWVWLCDLMNTLDVALIMLTGVLPMWILGPAGVQSESLRVLQVLRVLRLLRVIRLLRTNRHLRTPYKLVQGFCDSGRTVLHTYLVTGAGVFTFAVFGVYYIGRTVAFQEDPATEELAQAYFRTVSNASFTLVQVATLDSWTSIVRPLMKYKTLSWMYFVATIMVMTLVLQNLITAVICNNAFRQQANDHELQATKAREAMEAELNDFCEIFNAVDVNGDGLLQKEEYDDAVQNNEKVKQKLLIMQVSPCDVGDIWDVLNAGAVDGINMEQFASSMRAMKGEAKAKDSFSVVQRLRRVNARIARLNASLMDCKGAVDRLRSETATVRRELASALHDVQQFIQHAGACVPEGPAPRQLEQLKALQAAMLSLPR